MERHKRIVASALAAVLLLAACSDGDPEGSAEGVEAIEPQPDADESDPERAEDGAPAVEAAPEPEPAEIDVTVVPDEITEEYVEAVLVELEGLYSEAYILFQATDEATIEVTDRLGAAFTESEYRTRLRQFTDIAEAGYPGYRRVDAAAPRTHEVQRILDSSATCVYAETLLDVSGVRVDAGDPQASFVELGLPELEPFEQLNPTPWVVHEFPSGALAELVESRPCG